MCSTFREMTVICGFQFILYTVLATFILDLSIIWLVLNLKQYLYQFKCFKLLKLCWYGKGFFSKSNIKSYFKIFYFYFFTNLFQGSSGKVFCWCFFIWYLWKVNTHSGMVQWLKDSLAVNGYDTCHAAEISLVRRLTEYLGTKELSEG